MQVLDARDPLRYRSEDMDDFARELHPAKASLMLLNKADLLPLRLRAAWADYFEARGVDFIFWSAKAASERPLNPGAPSRSAGFSGIPWPLHAVDPAVGAVVLVTGLGLPLSKYDMLPASQLLMTDE